MKTVFQLIILVFKLVYFMFRLFSSWTSGQGNQGIPRQAADPRGRTGFCWIRPWGQGSWTESDSLVLEEVARKGQRLPFFHLENIRHESAFFGVFPLSQLSLILYYLALSLCPILHFFCLTVFGRCKNAPTYFISF